MSICLGLRLFSKSSQ